MENSFLNWVYGICCKQMYLMTGFCATFVPDLSNVWTVYLTKTLYHVLPVMTYGCKDLLP